MDEYFDLELRRLSQMNEPQRLAYVHSVRNAERAAGRKVRFVITDDLLLQRPPQGMSLWELEAFNVDNLRHVLELADEIVIRRGSRERVLGGSTMDGSAP